MKERKPLLENVVIIRLMLILLLVFYHAFAPYSGRWDVITGFPEIPLYCWLDKFSYAFLLEMFVFISGYVFGYQMRNKGHQLLKTSRLFTSKFKRLFIPSIFFSTIYYFIFRDDCDQSISSITYDVLQGVGHLWFLPMLFWCFGLVWIVEKIYLSQTWALVLFFLLAVAPKAVLTFHFTQSLYYILFFYLGYILQKRFVNINKLYKPRCIAIFTLLFFILFPLLTLFQQYVEVIFAGENITLKMAKIFLTNISKVIYAVLGIIMILAIVGYIEIKQTKPLSTWIIKISETCMGVYLLHQFILKYLYYLTSIPNIIGPYLLPWLSFLLTLISCLILVKAIKKFKIGNYLIG